MQQQLLSQSFLGLTLGMLVLASTLPAHADANAPNEGEQAVVVQEAPQKVTEMKVKTVMLPAEKEESSRVNRPLMLTSSVLFATGYVPALVTTLANSKNTSGWLGVPVVGPWIDWGPNTSAGNKALLFGSGLLQALGVAGVITSFFVPESKTKKVPMMGKRMFNVSPVASRGTYALSASGTF
jgi:hypothetical protein